MREGPDGKDAPSTEAGVGEERSPSGSEEGRRDVEEETADEREYEGEGDEESKEETIVGNKGVETAEERESEGEEVEDDGDVEADGSEGKDEGVSEDEEEPGKVSQGEQEAGSLNAEEEVEMEIINVDDLPSKDKGTPVDERTTRRHSRRVRNDVEAPPVNQLQKLRLQDEDGSDDDVPQVQEPPAGTTDISPEISAENYEEERKRKGKEEAKAQMKKHRQASRVEVTEEPTLKTIRVPFAAATGEESNPPEPEEETEDPPEEEGVYEKMEVLVTKKLLETMVQFRDPNLTKECGGKVGNGKVAKSGKSLCLSDLRDLGAEEKFISYVNNIGFEWLLDNCDEEVPVPLAKEFFTSFHFKPTTDPDADSITFRIFN